MALERLGDSAEFRALVLSLAREAPETWAAILRALVESEEGEA
jgi:hypothetical protein